MHPELFRLGPVVIHSYGTMLMAGFLAGMWLAAREARRRGLAAEVAVDLALAALVGGVLGARLVFAALNWSEFSASPWEIAYLWREGGLSFHGGLVGGVVAGALLAWKRRLSFWTLADVAAPGLALGYAIARVGCLLNGCCYGAPTSLPWGIRFPLFPDAGIYTYPSHPTQIYSSLGSLVILAVLLKARARLSAPGQLFCLYLVLYSVLRSGIEVLRRGYTARTLFDGITQAQAASAALLVVGLVGMWLLRRPKPTDPASP